MRECFLRIRLLKWVLLLCLVCVMKVAPAMSQQLSLKFTNSTMEQVLEQLKSRTSYDVLYNFEEIAKIPAITKEFKNVSVEEVLNYCLKNTNYTYSIVNNIIVIKLKTPDDKKETVLKQRTITGKVLDEKGYQLPGATIMIKGTKMGVATDVNGEFKISFIPTDSTILVISFVGMVSKEVKLSKNPKDDAKPLTVRLMEEKTQMEEVVITGYANINKKSFTGNTVNVKRDELLKVSKTNVLAALQTFDPSFRLQENTLWGSDPNAVPEMYMRGRSGIGVKELDSDALSKSNLKNNPNLPLFIMDGFEISVTKLYDLDMNRISEITLLKDAAATAIYGSRAANGVVVITTVAPTPGKLSVSYSMTGTLTMPDLTDYNLMNAREKLDTEVAAGIYKDDNYTKQYDLDREYNRKLANVVRGVDTYWLSKPLRTAFNHKHSLYIDGGTNDIRFGLDFGYNNDNGVMKGSYRDRINVGLYLDYRVGSFQVKNYISYGITKSEDSPYGAFSDYTSRLPYSEPKNSDGTYKRELELWHTSSKVENPLYEANLQSFANTNYNELINNLSANWYMNDFLQIKGQFTITKTTNKSNNYTDPLSLKDMDTELSATNAVSGKLIVNNDEGFNWDMNVVMSYNRSIEMHNVNFSLGVNATSSTSNSLSIDYRGFPSGDFSSPSYAQNVYEKPSNGDDKSRLVGFLGMVNYSYNNIYLFDASLRTDGSSKFGSSNKTALFWSLGAGLALNNYEFVKNVGFIDELKLHGSYGSTGKVNFEPYAAKTIYNVDGKEWYETGMGASMTAMGNKNLGWETTYSTDLGVDLGILDRLFYLTASWYNKKTVDLVNDVTIPSSTGFTTYKDNVGEMQNRGFEISLRSNIIKQKDLNLSLFGNLAHNENKLVKISNSLKAYNDRVDAEYDRLGNSVDGTKPLKKFEEGVSTTAISVVRSHGIDPATGSEILEKLDGTLTTKWDSFDQIHYGDTEPDIQGSFGFNFQYKQLSLYATFMYEYGGQRYNQTLVTKVENADIYNDNVDKRVFSDRWKKPGDHTKFKALESGKKSIVMTKASTRFVEDYNLISFNSLTLGYDLPPRLLKKIGFGMVRFELGANELARFCTVKQERGLSYPYARTMNFSLKASF